MRPTRRRGAVVLLVLATVLLSVLPETAQASNPAPFRAAWRSLDTLVTQNCPGIVCFASTGSGIATSLGVFTSTGTIVATTLTFPAPAHVKITTTETYVLTSTTGGSVDLTNVATGIEDVLTGRGSVSGRWTITGGTGRFSGAQGTGTTSGTLQAGRGGALRGTFILVGTISSPGSLP